MLKEDEKILILEKIKRFFSNNRFNYILFFCTYAKNIGFYFVHFFSKKKLKFFYGIKIILKDIYSSSYYESMYLKFPNKKLINYKSIIVSWGFRENFSKDGIFYDKILNSNSKKIKDNLWFIIYLDKKPPKKFKNNIILLIPYKKKKFNFIFFLKNLFRSILNFKFYSLVFNLQLLSAFNTFAQSSNFFFKKLLKKELKFIFMPYEAQPFQNLFFLSAKKISKKILTIGYIHSPPEAFPVQSIKKYGSPDKIILNGVDQIFCYKKFLGWKKSNILNLPSIRFKQDSKVQNYNNIYLPYTVSNRYEVIRNLEYLYFEKNVDIKNFKIKAHPHKKNSKETIKFIQEIKNIKKININKKQNKKISIFIGASGAVVEFLERGVEAIHISDNPVTDFYSSRLYPNIKVKNIKQNIFGYSLPKKKYLLNLGNRNTSLNGYIKKVI